MEEKKKMFSFRDERDVEEYYLLLTESEVRLLNWLDQHGYLEDVIISEIKDFIEF